MTVFVATEGRGVIINHVTARFALAIAAVDFASLIATCRNHRISLPLSTLHKSTTHTYFPHTIVRYECRRRAI